MNDNLKQALEHIYDEESAKYQIGEYVEFSKEFEHKMDRLIGGSKKAKPLSKRGIKALIIAAACAAALGIGITASAAATRGFTSKRSFNKDEWFEPMIKLTPVNTIGASTELDKLYLPTVLPEGYDYEIFTNITSDKDEFFATYTPKNREMFKNGFFARSSFFFYQYLKEEDLTLNVAPAYAELKEITVNGCPGNIAIETHYYGDEIVLVWDHGDYVMLIKSNYLSVDEVMRVAESVEVNENALKGEDG